MNRGKIKAKKTSIHGCKLRKCHTSTLKCKKNWATNVRSSVQGGGEGRNQPSDSSTNESLAEDVIEQRINTPKGGSHEKMVRKR